MVTSPSLVHPGQTGFDGIDTRGLPFQGGQQFPVTDAAGHQKRQREANAQEPGEVTHRRRPSAFRLPPSVFRLLPSVFRLPASGFGLRLVAFSL